MILILYAGLVLVVAQNRESIHPIGIVCFELVIFTIFAPMMLYGSIAGEREKRTWDLLLAAPITKAQIVAGKFMGALCALGVVTLFFQLPILIAAVGYTENPLNWLHLLESELVAFTFALDVCAITILFSARVKRGLMALGAVLGILTCGLVVIPAFLASMGVNGNTLDVPCYLHPFFVLSHLMERNPSVGSVVWGIPHILVYAAMAVVLLVWTENTLNFAENEVKFIPKGDKHA